MVKNSGCSVLQRDKASDFLIFYRFFFVNFSGRNGGNAGTYGALLMIGVIL